MEVSDQGQKAGQIWLMLMGLVVMLAGVGFTIGLWMAWQKAEKTRAWVPVSCEILKSKVVEQIQEGGRIQYHNEVMYLYKYQGKNFEGNKIKLRPKSTSSEDKARAIMAEYLPGMKVTGFVNPDYPSASILKHDTRAALYSIWFPLLFVFLGGRLAFLNGWHLKG
jgi:Protein of unknown function (DUF3592)